MRDVKIIIQGRFIVSRQIAKSQQNHTENNNKKTNNDQDQRKNLNKISIVPSRSGAISLFQTTFSSTEET